MSVESASLYIHIPFCSSICDYCDFYSVPVNNISDSCIDQFLSALIEDIKYQIEYFTVKEVPTVYIGGGTPSVLGKKIKILLDALNAIPGFSPVEFSIEANPESLTEEFLTLCRLGGINRLSLGVQTFHEPSRFAVNRAGDVKILQERLALATRYFPGAQTGFDLSADLITGLPYQNKKIIMEDIERILSFAVNHVSLYSLSVEKDIALLPNSEVADSLWLFGRDALLKKGFQHYEISNFAYMGKECHHNIRYWQMQSWLGAGPAASGTLVKEENGTAKRYTYEQDIDNYIKKPSIHTACCEEIDRATLLRESLLMAFRCKEGPDSNLFKQRFGVCIEECIPKTLAKWKDKNIMLFLNSFLTEAFTELDQSECVL
jgi:oxygen-independent coproporphyrinogen-3 oxidase